MNDKIKCKIIQEYILPNYIENLTDQETNNYLEEHFKECNECKQVLENMQKDIKSTNENKNKFEKNYMKKFHNKILSLKFIILSILLLILIIFSIITGRKMVIINDLSQKADKYKNSTNHHITTYYYAVDSNGEKWIKSEEFRLDDKIKSKVTEISDDGIIIETQYKNDKVVNDGFGVNTYLETTNGKFVCFNYTNSGPYNSLNNPLLENKFKTNNFFELFKLSVKSNIDNATYNGKECYYITNFENYRPQGVYVNKDIGMPTRENSSESTYENGRVEKKEIIDVIYDFDTVTEEDFIEPNSSEYKIVEDLSQIE